jgi:serine O-acetyltransferase
LLCRLSYWFHLRRLGFVSKILALMNFIVFGIEITPRTSIGKGLFFPHTQGTVIGAASIGQNATIYHGVTLGAKSMDAGFTPAMRPVIGDNVLIAAGAKVLGGIEVGDSVRIGTNSVVLKSVPAGSLVRTLQAEIMPPAP